MHATGQCPVCRYPLSPGWREHATRCTECGAQLPPGADAHAMLLASPERCARVARVAGWLCLAMASDAISLLVHLTAMGLESWQTGVVGPQHMLGWNSTLAEVALKDATWFSTVLSLVAAVSIMAACGALLRLARAESRVLLGCLALLLLMMSTPDAIMMAIGSLSALADQPSLHAMMQSMHEWSQASTAREAFNVIVMGMVPSIAAPAAAIALATLPLGRTRTRRIRMLAIAAVVVSLVQWWPSLAEALFPGMPWIAGPWLLSQWPVGSGVLLVLFAILALVLRPISLFSGPAEPGARASLRLWAVPGLMAMCALLAWASPPNPAIEEWTHPISGEATGYFLPTAEVHRRVFLTCSLLGAWLVPWALYPRSRVWRWWLAGSLLALAVSVGSILSRS